MWALNFLKPPGMTSHDAVSFVRKAFNTKRVGHAGTLDPAASGVLPIFIGRGTRLVEYMTDADKKYRTEVIFGEETDTGDYTGCVVAASGSIPNLKAIEKVIGDFCGTIEQVPPIYSAIKVDGKKMYDLARAGINVECRARTVTIKNISILSLKENKLRLDVECGKGTYIRSLCRDLGRALGTAATMGVLLRTAVGGFLLKNAYTVEEVVVLGQKCLTPADGILFGMEECQVGEEEERRLLCGQRLRVAVDDLQPVKFLRAYNKEKIFIGIIKQESGVWNPHKMMNKL